MGYISLNYGFLPKRLVTPVTFMELRTTPPLISNSLYHATRFVHGHGPFSCQKSDIIQFLSAFHNPMFGGAPPSGVRDPPGSPICPVCASVRSSVQPTNRPTDQPKK